MFHTLDFLLLKPPGGFHKLKSPTVCHREGNREHFGTCCEEPLILPISVSYFSNIIEHFSPLCHPTGDSTTSLEESV